MKTIFIPTVIAFSFIWMLVTSCKHEPELIPGTPEVCFDRDVMLIINSNCNVPGCHGSNGEAPSLSTYDDVRRFVEPGKPVHSKLHEVITANPNSERFMPPKPKTALTNEQIDILSLWILQGAEHTTCP